MGTGILCPLLCTSAGAVYLKNCVFKYWKPHDPSDVGDELPPYSIPEQAKSLIRDNIVGAIIRTPLLIRCVRGTHYCRHTSGRKFCLLCACGRVSISQLEAAKFPDYGMFHDQPNYLAVPRSSCYICVPKVLLYATSR